MYHIAESEIESIGNATLYFSLDVGLLGISLGGFIAFGIVLLTVEIQSPMTFATFIMLLFATGLASVFFGIRTRLSWRQMKSSVKDIKNR